MNIHAISTANLALNAEKILQYKEEKCDFIDEEVDSMSDDTYDTLEQKRTLTIDYSGPKWKTSISSFFPAIIIWILALSIALPAFIFSTTLKGNNNYCVHSFNNMKNSIGIVEILMLTINIFIPILLFLITIFITFAKRKALIKLDEQYTDENPLETTKISLITSITFLVIQLPKFCIQIFLLFRFQVNINFYYALCSLCILKYLLVAIRPIMYMFNSKLRKKLLK